MNKCERGTDRGEIGEDEIFQRSVDAKEGLSLTYHAGRYQRMVTER